MSILFKGDNKALISSITALLALDAKGALSPHGIGEMARDLLETCAARLPAEQNEGEPVAWMYKRKGAEKELGQLVTVESEDIKAIRLGKCYEDGTRYLWPREDYIDWKPLYTHADSGEVVALRDAYLRAGEREHELRKELAQLRTALKFYADRDHYSTDDGSTWDSCSGEPANILWHESEPWFIEDGSIARAALAIAAERELPDCAACNGEGALGKILDTVPCPDCAAARPSEPDDLTDLATWKRRAIEAESKLRAYDPHILDLSQREMEALLADPRPAELVLMKCVLCDQLQADLTARDQRIDFLEQQVQLADHWLESASFNSVGEPIEHTQDMRDDFRKQMIAAVFPDYVEASTHGRLNGVPASPCVGCGAPGYTGNCNKCVPY